MQLTGAARESDRTPSNKTFDKEAPWKTKRPTSPMQAVVAGLSAEDMIAVAAYAASVSR